MQFRPFISIVAISIVPRTKPILSSSTDVKALTSDGPDIIPSLAPAFERYNETQLTTVKLPGASQEVRSHIPDGGVDRPS